MDQASQQAGQIDRAIVITTIHANTAGVEAFANVPGWRLIVAGDANTPPLESAGSFDFLSLDAQFGFARAHRCNLPRLLPENHYARKNAGYLSAIARGATVIYDTDDDNTPVRDWSPFPADAKLFQCDRTLTPTTPDSMTCNVYGYFAPGSGCWPLGYPLDRLAHETRPLASEAPAHDVGVWQGMVDDDPDVDAIWRLTRAEPVRFQRREPVSLAPGVWCPCNSQNTTWCRDAFRWLYLPSTTTMRASDIIRGYVAQRCLWADGFRLGFLGPTVRQQRNEHDLLKDFADETLLHTRAGAMIEMLADLPVESWGYGERLIGIYRALAAQRFVHRKELDLVEAWSGDIERLLAGAPAQRGAAA